MGFHMGRKLAVGAPLAFGGTLGQGGVFVKVIVVQAVFLIMSDKNGATLAKMDFVAQSAGRRPGIGPAVGCDVELNYKDKYGRETAHESNLATGWCK
jgi:hypothetical protein